MGGLTVTGNSLTAILSGSIKQKSSLVGTNRGSPTWRRTLKRRRSISATLSACWLISPLGGFEEEVRDGDADSNQELESVTLQVTERALEEDKNNMQVVCVSRDHFSMS